MKMMRKKNELFRQSVTGIIVCILYNTPSPYYHNIVFPLQLKLKISPALFVLLKEIIPPQIITTIVSSMKNKHHGV